MNNIGMVPALGIWANKGEKKVHTKKQSPHTRVDRPVLAPSFRPTPVSGERIMGGPGCGVRENREVCMCEKKGRKRDRRFNSIQLDLI